MKWRSSVEQLERQFLFNPIVVPITMARHGLVGENLGIPLIGVFGSVTFALIMWIIGSYVFSKSEAEAVKHL